MTKKIEKIVNEEMNEEEQQHTEKENKNTSNTPMVKGQKIVQLSEMFKDWFLDYASYVILERAIPNLVDGLKPVQRRILHAMYKIDDGRFTKVANIIGQTMQYHPHGDASIGDALVQLGQKDLLFDMQGNWGNTLTGDSAAAPRYIETRLSAFGKEVAFSPKITEWQNSYDGRKKEPVVLPVKFPLLLAQGVEGIAVGLASKILPHNFNELLDAAVAYLQEKPFELLPDFPTGGMADFSRYNDGLRGGQVKIRAKIQKQDNKTLIISELPFSKNTTTLIESIIKANDKGKIKIKKIDDNTADNVEIVIYLASGISPDQMIDALYAFTDCELSVYPNSSIIFDNKPMFIGVTEILKKSVDQTKELLRKELEVRKGELESAWHFANLERIFIEKRIYKNFEESTTWDAVLSKIDEGLEPYKKIFKREIVREDLVKLTEIKIKKTSRFDLNKAQKEIEDIEIELEEVQNHLDHLVDFTIRYYQSIKKKYGKGKERKTEIRNFENIEATKVVVANQKLYVDRKEGFFGTSLKKDEFVAECSDIDDVIVFLKTGKYMVTKVSDKAFFGKDILHIAVFKKNDTRRIYNACYFDGGSGSTYVKRFAITSVIRDKEYDLTKGADRSKILYYTVNPNGEAEVIRVFLKPRPRLKKLKFEFDFSTLAIKGRGSQGNILTKNPVHKIVLAEEGMTTLGGKNIWFDPTVFRLNEDERGEFLGEFNNDEKIIAFYKSGKFATTSYELTNHYDEDLIKIEKFNPEKIYTAIFWEADQSYFYIKRFTAKLSDKSQLFISENHDSYLVELNDFPQPELTFTEKNGKGESVKKNIIVEEFIGVKSYSARGKRLTEQKIKQYRWKDLTPPPEKEPEPTEENDTEKPEMKSLFDNEE
ncbi:MAG: DNA gyrase/topoisomerase IV subunit A [Bacteroidales bacterium]|nr:DNA gyrase/topoisomerase IV subunit A [Bacteroidales bacterium]